MDAFRHFGQLVSTRSLPEVPPQPVTADRRHPALAHPRDIASNIRILNLPFQSLKEARTRVVSSSRLRSPLHLVRHVLPRRRRLLLPAEARAVCDAVLRAAERGTRAVVEAAAAADAEGASPLATTAEVVAASAQRGGGGAAAALTNGGASGAAWRCAWCSRGLDQTPRARAGPDGAKTLCNACGLRYAHEVGYETSSQKYVLTSI